MNARSWLALRTALTLVVVAGLAVDAYVHFDLASSYAGVRTSTLNQGELFRVEGVLALLAAAALIVRPRRYTAGLALLVSAGGIAAVELYAYVNVGRLGPIPNMYDPYWYPEKTLSAWAEAIAAAAALALVIAMQLRAREDTRAAAHREASRQPAVG